MSGQNGHIYEFGKFRLIPAERLLLREGESVPLTPKVFETLIVLVEQSGHLVEKEELLQRVWDNAFVEEANVARSIHTLRKALGENQNGHQFIKTVPKRGYRFVADVRLISEAEPSPPVNGNQLQAAHLSPQIVPPPVEISSLQIPETQDLTIVTKDSFDAKSVSQTHLPTKQDLITPPARKRRILIGLLFAVISLFSVAILVVLLSFILLPDSSTKSNRVKTVAVLPLKPINSANRDELYEIGIADSLIHSLSTRKDFIVRPLSATRKYLGIEQDPVAAGREQRVDYVLASNYQLANGKIRVTSQLLNVANGQIEETYQSSEIDAVNIFAMQDAVAEEIGSKLLKLELLASNKTHWWNIENFRIGVSVKEHQGSPESGTPTAGLPGIHETNSTSPAAKRGTTNEEAYRLYLQAMYFYDRRNAADARRAADFLEQAVRLDPDYAQAWAGKAHAHRTVSNFGRAVNTHEEYRKSIEAINKALELDANLADAHSALCDNKLYYEYDFDGAERECQRAVELAPNSSLSRQMYARFLLGRGRFDEAITEIITAIDLEPTSLFNQRILGNVLFHARRYDEAAVQFKRVAAMDENFGTTYLWLSMTLGLQGKEAEAFEVWLKHLATQKADEETVRAFQTAFQTSGWQGVLRERVNNFEKGGEIYFHGAAYNALVGDKDKAFEFLEKSHQRREWGLHLLEVDPRLDNLRDDPRYGELVKRVESK